MWCSSRYARLLHVGTEHFQPPALENGVLLDLLEGLCGPLPQECIDQVLDDLVDGAVSRLGPVRMETARRASSQASLRASGSQKRRRIRLLDQNSAVALPEA